MNVTPSGIFFSFGGYKVMEDITQLDVAHAITCSTENSPLLDFIFRGSN